MDTCTGDAGTRGIIRFNELADGSGMMANCLRLNGGTPRALVTDNQMIGFNTAPVSVSAVSVFYWWARNNFGSSTGPFSPGGITVGASPFTYQLLPSNGTNPYPQDVVVRGGTVSKIEKKRGGAAAEDLGVTAGMFRLEVNDSLVVTYSVAPTMRYIPAAA
jgi:hypothetical protein